MDRQTLVTWFLDLCSPTSSNGVGVIPKMVRRTRHPIQTLSVSAGNPFQTTTTDFPSNGVKNARTVFGLRGGGAWARADEANAPADNRSTIANAEVFAEKGINCPFVRNFAPASVLLLNWQIGGEVLYSSPLGMPGWPDPMPTSLTESHGRPG